MCVVTGRRLEAASLQRGGKMLGTWETPVQQTQPRVLPSLGSHPVLGPHLSNERAGLDEIFRLYDASTVIRLGSLSPSPSTASLNKTHSNWGIRISLCLN